MNLVVTKVERYVFDTDNAKDINLNSYAVLIIRADMLVFKESMSDAIYEVSRANPSDISGPFYGKDIKDYVTETDYQHVEVYQNNREMFATMFYVIHKGIIYRP